MIDIAKAPAHYSNEEAHAWVAGYEQALQDVQTNLQTLEDWDN